MIYENYIRVLNINLSTRKIRIDHREDLMPYLGGVGVASKLLEETIKPELDALEEAQPIVFAVGACSSIFPVMTKAVAMFRSPLTGELGETYAGGRMALCMFQAGFDAIVITGKASAPIYLSISPNNINFKDARALWGGDSSGIGQVIREREPGWGKRSIIRIGQAGENCVSYANICVDTYRHFGRLGLGAVFGSKKLKAISIIGGKDIPIKKFGEYFKVYRELYDKCTNTEVMKKYHDIGTPVNIMSLNAAGGLPTRNLIQSSFEHADDLSGETFAEKNLIRKLACTGCPVGCIHIGQYRHEFDYEGYEYEAISVAYDYELIFALGTFLGIKTSDQVLDLIEKVEKYGLDAMSTGVVLGWATESFAKGLITAEDTIVRLEFSNASSYAEAIKYIALCKNEFYKNLGKGAYHAARVYGGEEFAMTLGKNEMPGYHTGYGAVVGASVGARHSHLCNGGYSLDQGLKPFDVEAIVDGLFNEEIERCVLNSLIICLFARKVYDSETVLKALKSIDKELTPDELREIGERIYKTKLRIKKTLGFDQLAVEIPKRFFQTPSMTGTIDRDTAFEMIRRFNEKNLELLNKS